MGAAWGELAWRWSSLQPLKASTLLSPTPVPTLNQAMMLKMAMSNLSTSEADRTQAQTDRQAEQGGAGGRGQGTCLVRGLGRLGTGGLRAHTACQPTTRSRRPAPRPPLPKPQTPEPPTPTVDSTALHPHSGCAAPARRQRRRVQLQAAYEADGGAHQPVQPHGRHRGVHGVGASRVLQAGGRGGTEGRRRRWWRTEVTEVVVSAVGAEAEILEVALLAGVQVSREQ